MPWEVTSSTAVVTPESTMRRRARWIAGASGVVMPVSATRPCTRTPRDPITPTRAPPAASADWIRSAVDVLPRVPVMPTSRSSRAGCR
jgi:hypothetical protein